MAVVDRKSANLTNRDSSPRVLNNGNLNGGRIKEEVGMANIATGDNTSSTYRLVSVPSNARPSYLKLYATDLGTTTKANVGIWSASTADATGTAIDADFFASDFTMAAIIPGTDIVHEADASPGYAHNKAEKMLWEVLGAATDPGTMYDIVVQLSGDADGSGALVMKFGYAV